MVIENAFLQRRQGINVLDVTCTARHRRDDLLDLRLGQRSQRQHVRCDARAIGRDTVGRHHDVPVATDGGSQRGQRRLAEQDPHIDAQLDLAHAFDHFHGQ